jgi:hypothetical protein
MNGDDYSLVQAVQNVQPLRSVQSPTSFIVAGDEKGGDRFETLERFETRI